MLMAMPKTYAVIVIKGTKKGRRGNKNTKTCEEDRNGMLVIFLWGWVRLGREKRGTAVGGVGVGWGEVWGVGREREDNLTTVFDL